MPATTATRARPFRRPRVNLTGRERLARVVLGATGALLGAALLATGAGTVSSVLEILLVATGLDLLVTGALGHCPLYAKLGYDRRSLRVHP